MLNKIKNPILFQGKNTEHAYFEGWYYKQVSPDEKTVICFIPGISFVPEKDSQSFVQYIYVHINESNNKIIKTGYFKYGLEDFAFDNHPFKIRIANNHFSESRLSLNLTDHDISIGGTLKLGSLLPIKKSILMPNIMGFFAYFPKMECYHGIVSMSHTLHGVLKINGEEIDFNEGKGYIEKDWGTSFPKKYIWIQCNNFKNKNTSFFCSIADIPFLHKCFHGFICNLVIDDDEYRFATYNNSRFRIEYINNHQISCLFESKKGKLKIEANLSTTGELIAPQRGNMEVPIKEGISAEVKLYLSNQQNRAIYEDVGNMAGVEIFGFY